LACNLISIVFVSSQANSSSRRDGDSGVEDDSELPKFTLGELRGVLNERNKLKMRLYEMEEELERLCPSSPVYFFIISQLLM
jgi:Rab interacting lysosomal protein